VTRLVQQRGYTLVELMVVVAVVGVLASVAVFMFNKQKTKALASEVPVVFSEFKVRQEQFRLENDEYLTTGANDDDLFPTTNPGRNAVAFNLSSSPVPPEPQGDEFTGPSWQTLRINVDKKSLYCGYVAVSGKAGDNSTIGAVAAAPPFNFGSSIPVPATDWYYLLAKCDFDGDGINSLYFTLSGTEGIIEENAGE
jgi:prepilin-type N-terminal cleavage/methylation domain-containing protein